jgi:hypothetical protein
MTWFEIADRFGVPLTCLGALALAVWKVLVWLGNHVVEPSIQAHCNFLKAQTEAMQVIAADVKDIKGALLPSRNGPEHLSEREQAEKK